MAEIVWRDFIDYLRKISGGVDHRDLQHVDAVLRSSWRELRPTHDNAQPLTDEDHESRQQLLQSREDRLHRSMLDITAAALSARSVRCLRAELRRLLVDTFIFSEAYEQQAGDTVQKRQPPLFHGLVRMASAGGAGGIHLGLYPGEPALEALVAECGPYVRQAAPPPMNPTRLYQHQQSQQRRSTDEATQQQLLLVDASQRALQWSDHKLEHLQHGRGSVFAKASVIYRRKMVFVVTPSHGKAFPDDKPVNNTASSWKVLKDVQRQMYVNRQRPTLADELQDPTDGGDSIPTDSGASMVHVIESTQIRSAAALDDRSLHSLLSTVRASILHWEKLSQGKREQSEKKHRAAEADSAASTSAAAASSMAKEAVFVQVLVLIDTDTSSTSEHTMRLVRTVLLPKLRHVRQSSTSFRGARLAFDVTPHVVLDGSRLLPIVTPRATDDAMALDSIVDAPEDPTVSAGSRPHATAAQLHAALRDFPTMVAFCLSNDHMVPAAVARDLRCEEARSMLFVSFFRDPLTPVAPSQSLEGESGVFASPSVSVLYHFPGGERKLDRRIVQLLLQTWIAHNVFSPSARKHHQQQPQSPVQSLIRQCQSYFGALFRLSDRVAWFTRIGAEVDALHETATQLLLAQHRESKNHSSAKLPWGWEPDPVDDITAFTAAEKCTTPPSMELPEIAIVSQLAATLSSPTTVTVRHAPAVAKFIYADLLHVVLRVSLQFPPPACCMPQYSDVLPIAAIGKRSAATTQALVGHSTILAIVASLLAAYGIRVVIYDNAPGDEASNDVKEDQAAEARGLAQGVCTTSITVGFSPMEDISDYGQAFVDEGHYAPAARQLIYLQQMYWPLLIRLRYEAVERIRIASTIAAQRVKGFDSVAGDLQQQQQDTIREVFVVAVGDDEDTETLERADKTGELSNALSMPIARLFLIPTPLLLAAVRSGEGKATTHSKPRPSESPAVVPTSPTSSGKFSDDALFLAPQIYEPEDAETIQRICSSFAAELAQCRLRRIEESKHQAALEVDETERNRHLLAGALLSHVQVRLCGTSVLHPNRFRTTSSSGQLSRTNAVGPLLPCVEVSLDYAAGPHLEPDDSIWMLSEPSKAMLHALCNARRHLLGDILSEWIMTAANVTLDTHVDVAKVKEEALVYAIRAAERMLAGLPPSAAPDEPKDDEDEDVSSYHSDDNDSYSSSGIESGDEAEARRAARRRRDAMTRQGTSESLVSPPRRQLPPSASTLELADMGDLGDTWTSATAAAGGSLRHRGNSMSTAQALVVETRDDGASSSGWWSVSSWLGWGSSNAAAPAAASSTAQQPAGYHFSLTSTRLSRTHSQVSSQPVIL